MSLQILHTLELHYLELLDPFLFPNITESISHSSRYFLCKTKWIHPTLHVHHKSLQLNFECACQSKNVEVQTLLLFGGNGTGNLWV